MDKDSFFYASGLLANMGTQSFSMSMIIDWVEMANMASLSSGNVKALKESSGLKNWVAFIKVLVEAIFLMIGEDMADWYHDTKNVKKVVPTKTTSAKKNPFVDSDDDFVPKKTLPPPSKIVKKSLTKKATVVPKLKKVEKVRGGGADFNLELGLALSISEEEVSK